MAAKATWKPHETHGELTTKDKGKLPESVFAFPRQRKEPMTDASDDDREEAFANNKKAVEHYGIEVKEEYWKQLGKKPQPKGA